LWMTSVARCDPIYCKADCLLRLVPPALNDGIEECMIPPIVPPAVMETRQSAFWPQSVIEVGEADAHGVGYAFTEGDCLLPLERRKRAEQARGIVGEGASNERLIGLTT
jgi:hypothetical protein